MIWLALFAYNDATVLDVLPKYAVFPLISRQNDIKSRQKFFLEQ